MAAYLSYLRVPLAASSALVASVGGLLYWKQNELIYPRGIPPDSRTNVPTPDSFSSLSHAGLDWSEHYIDTPDHEKLHAYLIKPSNRVVSVPITVLMFHGNAGNIGHRLPIPAVLQAHLAVSVLMLEYRGYGKSTGDPDENGLNIDTQTALDWMRGRDDLKKTKFVVFGQSLGGAAAIQLVAQNQDKGDIHALVLENTFLSIKKMIPAVLPAMAGKVISPLCHQVWPSEDVIPKLRVPTLFLSGLQDEIVPSWQMRKLYDLGKMNVKIFKTFSNGSHNNTVAEPGFFEAIADFLREHVMKKG